jgi:hypothetical protein
MVNQKIVGITLILISLLVSTISVSSDTIQEIDVTLSPNTIADITLSSYSWSHYENLLGTSNETGLTTFMVDNNGTVAVDVVISGTDTVGWTLATTPARNIFALQFKINGTSDWVNITKTPGIFVNSLGYNECKYFGLKIYFPTSTDQTSTQHITITFNATAC